MPVSMNRIRTDLEAINRFTANPGSGWTRLTFTPEWLGAIKYVEDQLVSLGAETAYRPGGSLVGRLAGSDPAGLAVMSGSHLDTVLHGGRFDGVVGVVAALETARAMVEDGFTPKLNYDLVVFAEEEGTRFGGGLAGSAIMTGRLAPDRLDGMVDREGISYRQALDQSGLVIEDRPPLHPADLRAMVELHIEQAEVLAGLGLSLGLVEAIAGIRLIRVKVAGRADHAGARPMDQRLDAAAGAAEMILRVERIAKEMGPPAAATVGRVEVEPGSANVIPGQANFTIDARHTDPDRLDGLEKRLGETLKEIAAGRGLTVTANRTAEAPPVSLSADLLNRLRELSAARGITPLVMPSGASHDTAHLAELTEAAMIFLPSIGGRSHCPEEETALADIVMGTELVSDLVRRLSI